MKCKSVADIKFRHNKKKEDVPKEGTDIRQIYDLFQNNKGTVLKFTRKDLSASVIPYLTDFYGLDIRGFGKGKWCLVGEWFGKDYVDYIAKKIKVKGK